MNRFPLAGKTAVVTGGAGGIGFAIASRFAHEGASVVLAGRTQSKLHAALSQLQEIKPWTPPQPQAHSTHCLDVRTPRGWASLVEAHVRLFVQHLVIELVHLRVSLFAIQVSL